MAVAHLAEVIDMRADFTPEAHTIKAGEGDCDGNVCSRCYRGGEAMPRGCSGSKSSDTNTSIGNNSSEVVDGLGLV